MKLFFSSAIIFLCTILAGAPEGFENLFPAQKWQQDALQKQNWQFDPPLRLPRGWYLATDFRLGEYKIIKNNAYAQKQSIFLKGRIMADATLFKRQKQDDTAYATFYARGRTPATKVFFQLNYQDAAGKTIGTKKVFTTVSNTWKEYEMKLDIPQKINNTEIAKIAPSIGSETGAFFDNVDFTSGCDKKVLKAAAGTVLMDFDFSKCADLADIGDKTGKFRLYSDCGRLQQEENALRVAFGARFRIPCPDDALGENFTILVKLAKTADLNGLFRTPIISKGVMQPYAGPRPGKDKFDFAFDINAWHPGFYYVEGGVQTAGIPYNKDFRFMNNDHGKADPAKIFEFDRFQHLAAVYNRGAVKLYINGIPVAENPDRISRSLCNSKKDIYLGSFRVENETDNQTVSEMLVESLKIIAGSMAEEDIRKDADELLKRRPGKISLQPIKSYYSKEMLPNDPEMKNRLKQTAEYLAAKPADPYANLKEMRGKYTGDADSLQLLINGKPVAPIIANPHGYEKREPLYNEFIADFAAADVNLIRAGVLADEYWIGERTYDWSKLDSRMNKFIEINPKAKLTVSLACTPPKWFYEKYPEELEEYYMDWKQSALGRKKWYGHGGPMGSDKWLAMSVQMIRDFVRHVENSPYKNHVYGYSICGGDANEWYWPGQFAGLTGYSVPTRNNFRLWLREKYKTNEVLAKSWQMPGITFDKVEVPEPARRFAAENGTFRDPETAADVADFRRFINDRTLHNFRESCKAARETASADKIITTYYGYSMYYAGRGVLHVSGLQTTSDVFKSPYIDAIATPIDYLKRRGGQPGINIAGFTGAAQLFRKMIWREEDLRTHLYPRLEYGRTATLRESMETIRRAYGYTVGENYGMYFVCQAGMHAYHQNEMMEDIAKMQKIVNEVALKNRNDVAEVALIFDEKESVTNLAASYNGFVIDHIWGIYQKMHSAGFPFKVYFLDDLANKDMPDFKLYVFVNPWAINDAQRKMIHDKLARNKATALFNYAPGYIANNRFDVNAMQLLTGIKFNEIRKRMLIKSAPADDSVIAQKAGSERTYAFAPAFFAVKDDDVKPFAMINGKITAAEKKNKDFTAVWSLLPPSTAFLTELARRNKVHIYSGDNAMLLANDSYVVIHGAKAGIHTIDLPRKYEVTELISGKKFGNTDKIKDKLNYTGETRIYQLK